MDDFTFLPIEQLFGDQKLEVLKQYGPRMSVTDFSILLGAFVTDNHHSREGVGLEYRTGYYASSSSDGKGAVSVIKHNGYLVYSMSYESSNSGRPALHYSDLSIISNNKIVTSGVEEIEYGEYPQMAVSESDNISLEILYNRNSLNKTGKCYTTDSRECKNLNQDFTPMQHQEFELNGKKYVRIISKDSIHSNGGEKISNGMLLKDMEDRPIWIEVSPIRWLVDEKTKTILSTKGIFSGIRFYKDADYEGDFQNTEVKIFMDRYFSIEIIPSKEFRNTVCNKSTFLDNYNFIFNPVSEEDIIEGCVESDIAVFLHGASSEGKSARVKQLDPDCEVIYLINATPESLNGRSVYNQEKGEMIDIPPSWYIKVTERCKREPNKIHIVFFDEISNALPSIQSMAFNIVFEREINGKWKLPDNCRIVAAGNDMNDSIAANNLAEPLFNRFAHVYINTNAESWLKWAATEEKEYERLNYIDTKRERKIHPAIYAFISYKGEKFLRSPYTGDKPNANPRKWEMASKLLYKTNNPEMLRALVGEDITKDFISFCKRLVVKSSNNGIDDIINGEKDTKEKTFKRLVVYTLA